MKRFLPMVLCAASSLLLASPALAEWSSGGGKLITDAENPWFVHNTTQITYCVGIDAANFGASETIVQQSLTKAIQFWQSEFKNSSPVDNEGVEIKVGTQQFVEVDCSESPDVAFQFGYLTPDQLSKLDGIKRYGALTIRTEYDKVNLRGKGFVYLSPEYGPLAPTIPDLTPHRWTIWNARLLELTLIHELGHIFGLPAMDPYMTEDFVDELLGPSGRLRYRAPVNPGYFKMSDGFATTICYGAGEEGEKLLRIPRDWKCLKVEKTREGALIYAAPDRFAPFKKVGEFFVTSLIASGGHEGQIWLPAEQQVFPQWAGKEVRLPLFGTGGTTKRSGKFKHVDFGILDSSFIFDISTKGFHFDAIDADDNIYLDFLRIGPFQYPLEIWD